MRTIRLNGDLGKKYGRVHKMDVRTPAEAIRALCANYPGFHQEIVASADRGVGYRCVVDRETVGEDAIAYPMSKTFSITPVVQGGGKAIGIILGVALIAAAFIFAPYVAPMVVPGTGATVGGFVMGASIGFAGLTYGNIAMLGAALVLSGVSQLMAPTPKNNGSSGQTNENRYFDGPANTTAQGSTVPVGYGRAIIGSAVISAAISVQQQSPNDYAIGGYYGGNLYA